MTGTRAALNVRTCGLADLAGDRGAGDCIGGALTGGAAAPFTAGDGGASVAVESAGCCEAAEAFEA